MDIIEFHDLESGTVIYIQVPKSSPYGHISSPSGGNKKTIEGHLKASLQSLQAFGKGVVDTVKELHPDEVEVKMGLVLNISEGKLIGLLARAEAETSFEVTLKWNGKAGENKPSLPKP